MHSEQNEGVIQLPRGWDRYHDTMLGGVPSLPDHYVERCTPANESFVHGIVAKLLAGS